MRRILILTLLLIPMPRAVFAQVTPASGYTSPDDTPSIKVGVTIYTDYTYQQNPTATDTDGNTINPSSFNVSRSYINVTGNVSHIVAFRITLTWFERAGWSLWAQAACPTTAWCSTSSMRSRSSTSTTG